MRRPSAAAILAVSLAMQLCVTATAGTTLEQAVAQLRAGDARAIEALTALDCASP